MLRSFVNKISLGLVVILLFSIIGCVRQDNNSSGDVSGTSSDVSESSTAVSGSENSSEEAISEAESSSESSTSGTESVSSVSSTEGSSSVSSGSSTSSVSSSVSSSTSSVSSSSSSSSSSVSSSVSSSTSSVSSVSSLPSTSSSISSSSQSSSAVSSEASSSSSVSSISSSTPPASSEPSSSASSSSEASSDSFYDGWTLVWSDEFNGTQIDRSVWRFERGANIRNNELQYYSDGSKNAYIEDGCLVIKTIKENVGGANFTSASMNTKGRKFFTFGRIEMRAKLPYGPGIWPAFWMCGENGRWPNNGEIDIMEFWGGTNQDHMIKSNVHWNQNGHTQWGAKAYSLSGGKRFADDFHTIGMEWDENALKFYVDGKFHNVFYLNTPLLKDVFTKDFYLWVNTAVNPHTPEWGWQDAYLNTYPQYYTIDYIRVYQKSN